MLFDPDPPLQAAVIGDTVGDPLKDTSGPSLNILIKLMAVESLVLAPFFLAHTKDGLIFQVGGLASGSFVCVCVGCGCVGLLICGGVKRTLNEAQEVEEEEAAGVCCPRGRPSSVA